MAEDDDRLGDFADRLAAVATATEAALAAVLDEALAGAPPRLATAMRYAVLGGGKRFRPFLVVETAGLFGVPSERALRVGAALECVHAYSLVHDDLPAMDDDALRRGRPTVHIAFDEATAILAGDALLTLAFEVLAAPETHPDPALRTGLVVALARAAGAVGMCGGQAMDLAAEANGAAPEAAAVADIQGRKTGALLAFAVAAGARLGSAPPAEATALADYAGALGAAFQLSDDILDAEGDAATVGKAVGKDAGRHKATLVAALGLPAAKDRLGELVAAGEAALDRLAPERPTGRLRAALRFMLARRN